MVFEGNCIAQRTDITCRLVDLIVSFGAAISHCTAPPPRFLLFLSPLYLNFLHRFPDLLQLQQYPLPIIDPQYNLFSRTITTNSSVTASLRQPHQPSKHIFPAPNNLFALLTVNDTSPAPQTLRLEDIVNLFSAGHTSHIRS